MPPCCQAVSDECYSKAKLLVAKARTKIDVEKKKTVVEKQEVSRLNNIKAANAQKIDELKATLESTIQANTFLQQKNTALEHRVASLQQSVLTKPAANIPKGSYSVVFPRTSNPYVVPDTLMQAAKSFQKKWCEISPTKNKLTVSGKRAYGETSFGTMARICHLISSELQHLGKPLQPCDILLDWGCGAGNWLCFARELLGVPSMVALGIEMDDEIYAICTKNLRHISKCNVLQAESETFKSFCPARVVVNYDGGNQALLYTPNGTINRTIMRTAFSSPTVDVVVSSRLNWNTFWTYFKDHLDRLGGSVWKCIYVEDCRFGKSTFNYNVWFRVTPMHKTCEVESTDERMQKMLAGVIVL
jgi:hypothetical protein